MDKKEAVKNVLAHHGTKGMKWGVRRSRSSGPSDVSVKSGTSITGKATVKTSGGVGHPAHPDSIAAKVIKQKLAKSGAHSLSNEEIQKVVTRHNLEQQVARVPTKSGSYAKAVTHVSSFLKSPHGQATVSAAKEAVKSPKGQKAIAVVKSAVSR